MKKLQKGDLVAIDVPDFCYKTEGDTLIMRFLKGDEWRPCPKILGTFAGEENGRILVNVKAEVFVSGKVGYYYPLQIPADEVKGIRRIELKAESKKLQFPEHVPFNPFHLRSMN